MYTILCVDDDKKMLSMLRLTLQSKKHSILTAESGEEGLTLMKQHQVQLVLSDFIMPNMNGVEFLKIVRREYPRTICFIITGTPRTHSAVEESSPGVVHTYFKKPLDVEELRLAVEMALEEWEAA